MGHRTWLAVSVACLGTWSMSARAGDDPRPVPPEFRDMVVMTDGATAAQKGGGFVAAAPATSLSHPAVRLWDEVKPRPPVVPGSGTVTVTTGR